MMLWANRGMKLTLGGIFVGFVDYGVPLDRPQVRGGGQKE